LGASVFPDGFIVLLGFCVVVPVVLPDPIPVVPRVMVPVPLPLIDAPPVVELPAELPVAPPDCASANVEDSANAVARAIVVSFMVIFLRLLRLNNAP
jgi:hypothetical protein